MKIVIGTDRFHFPRPCMLGVGLLACLASVQAQVHKPEQSPKLDLKSFVGTWKAEYKGQIFAILKLHMGAEKLTGTAETTNLNSDGAILRFYSLRKRILGRGTPRPCTRGGD